MAEKAKQIITGIELQEAPPLVHEAHSKLLDDLAIVIGASYQMVIEPTQAGKVPKRLANKIFPLLHGSRPAHYEDTDNYLDMVFSIAETLDLLELRVSAGQKARFMPGSQLTTWSRLQPFEQVCQLLEVWQSPVDSGWSDVAGANYRPSSYIYSYYMDMHSARTGLLDYLKLECEPGQWYALTPFLQNIKAREPLLLREHSRYAAYSGMRNRQDIIAHWDETDSEIIAGMLTSSFHELGLVTLGYDRLPKAYEERGPRNPDAFCFTPLAALALWHKSLPGEDVANERAHALIVQPNFELLLLHPDYPTLYQLLPFARIDQVEMVSKLTLTQESVRRGVEAGYGVERALRTLQEHSQKDLPQNVLYTLQDWGRLYKNATISQVILLEVDSESVADEICASSKTRALELRRLGPCAIAVGAQVSLQVLRTTLEKEGVILHIQGDILSARDIASASTYYGRRR